MRFETAFAILSATSLWLATASGQTTTRESVSSFGVQTSASGAASISADGRLVAFESDSTVLVPGDTNALSDIFVRDRLTGQTTRVSLDSSGLQANGNSNYADISADGRCVVFESDATNLVVGDTNNRRDVFCHDRLTGLTTRVSVGAAGQQATAQCGRASVSGDGRFVAFQTADNMLVPGDLNLAGDVFLHDRQTGQTLRASVGYLNNGFDNWDRQLPQISDDGLFVSFFSQARDLVANDTNGCKDVFVYERVTGTITRASVGSLGTQSDADSDTSSISADGRYVAFDSQATNLVPNDTNSAVDVFVHDRLTGTTSRSSVNSAGAETLPFTGSLDAHISGDGRFVTFWSGATTLVPGDTNGRFDCFVRDLLAATTTRISVTANGAQANAASSNAAISTDGRSIVFTSSATNLVLPGPPAAGNGVYVRDLLATAAVSAYGVGCPGTGNRIPSIAAGGVPRLGNAGFRVGVSNGLAGSVAALALSFASASIPTSGCTVLVANPLLLPLLGLDTTGGGATAFPLPNDPGLVGLAVFGQYLALDPNGPFLAGDATLSQGLRMQIGS